MEKTTKESAQLHLMQYLKAALPANLSLADELADLLKVSNDSAYRRMRGETALSIEEIAAICKRFKLSFDSFINNNESGLVTFSYHRLNSGVNSYKEYLTNVHSDLKKIMSFENRQIIYAAEDIPLFYHFYDPALAAFKMFYWNKSILTSSEFENKKFDKAIIDNELISTGEQILNCYAQIPSIEIWSDDTVNSTIKQIEFYWEAGIFRNKEDALEICDRVAGMFERIGKQAELNEKLNMDNKQAASKNNYALYHSDIMIGTNCVLVDTNGVKSTYLSYHTFNTMLTSNKHFCDETDLWLTNLIKKSNLISGVAEKQRYQFFKRINDALNKLVEKIQNS